ncbi:MAK10-like protein [Tanacetum coccineum]|uniref:MAK10-like protein n=1 Tax=Tanacetum coccineum TaxID=301880 RepID=A0ABQ5EVB3_9ASTR
MGDENPIRTLGDYSKPSHEGYRNTIELPVGNNVVPLRSDTIRLVQNGCSFHGLRSEDPNQHLKDFLKLVDSLDLDGENRERTRLRLFQFSLRDQASNWLERLPAGSISTWEDLTTRFLAQFFPPGRTAKLRNDILMFQQHHGESLSEAWTRFKDLLQKVPHHGIDLWLQVQIFYDHVNPITRRTIDQSAGGKLRDLNPEESWAILEDLALYDNESWNDIRDFVKPVKAIALPQDVPSTSDRRLIELENQVQRLMEAHLAPTQPTQVNKITTPCDICSGPHDTRHCMENPEQAFVEYASSRTDEAGVLEVLAHAPIYNIILDKYVKSLELGKNGLAFVQGETPAKMGDPGLFTLPCRLGGSKPFDTLADLGSCVNIIPLYLFKKLNIGLLEETDHIFGLADGTKSYPVGIVKDVEVHIGRLKLLNDFYVLDMKKDPKTPLLVGRGFLATANAVIDCRMARIAVGEGITRSVFGVKGVDLGEEEAPYWTTLGKRESYKPRPSTDEIGAKPPYYARKDVLDCHLPEEWEISRDAELNPFKDTLVFRRMVEFLGATPINLKCNMWESKNLIEKPINKDKPPKNGDGAWHAKIRLIDPDGEEFTKTLQSIPTTRKLSERESPREIINLDHFYDT